MWRELGTNPTMCGETLWSNLLLSSKFSREREREYIYNRSHDFDLSRSEHRSSPTMMIHEISWRHSASTDSPRWRLHLSISFICCSLSCSTIILHHVSSCYSWFLCYPIHDLILQAAHVSSCFMISSHCPYLSLNLSWYCPCSMYHTSCCS